MTSVMGYGFQGQGQSSATASPAANLGPSWAGSDFAARALASIHGMRGDSLDQAGDKVAAIGAFEQGLAIVERLAAKDRGNKTLEPDIQEYRRILARLRGR